ncbi:hypothetical protein DPMN_049554 [Dreissena polymorpha]|uniref:Uncharacterized protein n=1 Tax=Dreissena polymorpha TaxID=45954 RepID=A0A9D4HMA5_DREPO|nr:hypothetical protein DPMN_049554 [Dreissena polymorpha]
MLLSTDRQTDKQRQAGRQTDGRMQGRTDRQTDRMTDRLTPGKNAPSPGGHVFPLITNNFKLIRHINKTNVLTKFHLMGHVTRWIKTIFELNRRIQENNVLNKCNEDSAKNVSSRLFTRFHFIYREKTAPHPGDHIFSLITNIFKLNQDIHKTNVLTKFHDDWTKKSDF